MTVVSPTASRYLAALDTTLAAARDHVAELEAERTRVLNDPAHHATTLLIGWNDQEPAWMVWYLHRLRRSRSPRVVAVSRAALLLAHALLIATLAGGRSVRPAHARQLRALIVYLDEVLGVGLNPSDLASPTSKPSWDILASSPPRKRLTRGSHRPPSKLTDEQVLTIRAQAAAGRPFQALADEAGVTRMNVHLIVTRATWKHLP